MDAPPAIDLDTARAGFAVEPGLAYLDAATYGLPPRQTVETLERALRRWQAGTADWVEEWDREGEACRALFAAIVGCPEKEVALLPSASVGVGLVAAALPAGTEVVVPEGEFASVLAPLLVAAEANGVRVREVPFAELAAGVGPRTELVAFSLTRSQDGATADLAAVVAAAARHGAKLLVDATHAVPFVPVGEHLPAIDYLVCHGYKHLLCPRGVAFMTVKPARWPELPPWLANWRSAEPLYGRNYGGPLALPGSAARYDVSLAWHAWAGARPSLEAILGWQCAGLLEEPLALARRLAAGLGLPPPSASIVAVESDAAEVVAAALEKAEVRCAARGGRVRFSTHLWNTAEEIDRVIEIVGGVLAGGSVELAADAAARANP